MLKAHMQIVARPNGQCEIRLKDLTITLGDNVTIGDFALTGPGEYEVGGVMAEASPTATRFFAEDLTLGHLGSRTKKLSDEELEQLGSVDVLFFPLGEESLAPKDASVLLAQIEAPIMIPLAASAADIEAFCQQQTSCERLSGPLKLSRSQLPTEGSRIIVFEGATGE